MRQISKGQIGKRGRAVEVEAFELDGSGSRGAVVEVRATVGQSSYAMRWGVGAEGDTSVARLQAELDRLRDVVAEEAARLEDVRVNLSLVK